VEACPRSALSVISDESKFEKYILSQYVEYSKLSEEE
jgi:hypothetical protein